MQIAEAFNRIANDYDHNRRRFIPCFDDFYFGTTNFLSQNIQPPQRVLDLGSGTGLLAAIWKQIYPNAEYVLIDFADGMLEQARRRFADQPKVVIMHGDYTKVLPEGPFDAVISALSLHHLDAEKPALYKQIRKLLPNDGIFVNYDQYRADSERMETWFDNSWVESLRNTGLDEQELEAYRQRRLLDRECTPADDERFMKEAGFETADCIFRNGKFGVVAATCG